MSTESSTPTNSLLQRKKGGNTEGPFELVMNVWRGQNGAWPQVQSTGRYLCSTLQFLSARRVWIISAKHQPFHDDENVSRASITTLWECPKRKRDNGGNCECTNYFSLSNLMKLRDLGCPLRTWLCLQNRGTIV